jgi:hypothetical protein
MGVNGKVEFRLLCIGFSNILVQDEFKNPSKRLNFKNEANRSYDYRDDFKI